MGEELNYFVREMETLKKQISRNPKTELKKKKTTKVALKGLNIRFGHSERKDQ